MMNNLTAIYWVKNEARYIPEWVEFHLLQGYDHFILYDNKSTDNLLEIVKPYLDAGLLEIRYYPAGLEAAKNFWLAEECCGEQKGKSKWIDFRSVDERTFCPDGRLIADFLKDYTGYGGVAVAWEEFNSSGHKTRPTGLLIENYTTTVPDLGHHIKTITQPEFAVAFAGHPHNFIYSNDKFTVNENRVRIDSAFMHNDYSYQKIKVHHYNTLSEEEFNNKMNKGGLDHGPAQENMRRAQAVWVWDYMSGADGQATFGYNDDLVKWAPIVKEAIKQRYNNSEHLLDRINH